MLQEDSGLLGCSPDEWRADEPLGKRDGVLVLKSRTKGGER